MDQMLRNIAESLYAARVAGRTIAPPSRTAGLADVAAAYAIQLHNRDRRERAGDQPIGRKVGLTSAAAQRQFAVESPALGTLWQSTRFDRGARIAIGDRRGVRVEAEIALVLGHAIADSEVGDDALRQAVRGVRAGLEIVDSRITDWQVTLADLVADNTAGWGAVIGADERPLADIDLVAAHMQMQQNGQLVSEGTGAAVLGNPLRALRWAAEQAIRLGRPLQAGEIVLTGSLGPVVAATAGDCFTAHISGFAPLDVQFRAGD